MSEPVDEAKVYELVAELTSLRTALADANAECTGRQQEQGRLQEQIDGLRTALAQTTRESLRLPAMQAEIEGLRTALATAAQDKAALQRKLHAEYEAIWLKEEQDAIDAIGRAEIAEATLAQRAQELEAATRQAESDRECSVQLMKRATEAEAALVALRHEIEGDGSASRDPLTSLGLRKCVELQRDTIAMQQADLSALRGQIEAVIQRVKWIQEFSEAHHAAEPSGRHLHSLIVDIPSYLNDLVDTLTALRHSEGKT
jgi:chromosome segregation ATPase